ncbi:uncharacterized protein SCODWIG_00259 [Saccharomycodes ludwigii]|uniref:H/ACA ribonucleoprotein complex non-core subunit NAF1 n=1 Tax=Saccharomycodes ludwigii TaxID=36035 RepID=A0A376B1D3_9ASCO|nr:hypothetical protein SCDLUD_002880 [Saccharomycodes ludwigii]KAH3901388.1 hypothetical protein SCDLUD_002880 [Saccharomycodes ludwigii]SSD58498.1 uncharacterized protein SCODWIG_00259 [Saccharomycodes ludwigii]
MVESIVTDVTHKNLEQELIGQNKPIDILFDPNTNPGNNENDNKPDVLLEDIEGLDNNDEMNNGANDSKIQKKEQILDDKVKNDDNSNSIDNRTDDKGNEDDDEESENDDEESENDDEESENDDEESENDDEPNEYDDDDDEYNKADVDPIRSEHETLKEPVLEVPKDFELSDTTPTQIIGHIQSVFESNMIIKSDLSAEKRVLKEGAIICLQNKTIVGRICEIFGPLVCPFYRISFKDKNAAEKFVQNIGEKVYLVIPSAHWTDTFELKRFKGSDASNVYDEEVKEEEQEFSDDEKEESYKRQQKRLKKQKKPNNNENNTNVSENVNKKRKRNNNTYNNNNRNNKYINTKNMPGSKYNNFKFPQMRLPNLMKPEPLSYMPREKRVPENSSNSASIHNSTDYSQQNQVNNTYLSNYNDNVQRNLQTEYQNNCTGSYANPGLNNSANPIYYQANNPSHFIPQPQFYPNTQVKISTNNNNNNNTYQPYQQVPNAYTNTYQQQQQYQNQSIQFYQQYQNQPMQSYQQQPQPQINSQIQKVLTLLQQQYNQTSPSLLNNTNNNVHRTDDNDVDKNFKPDY